MVDLRSKRVVLVTGKGGVGKSAVSAALAMMAARAGRKVLLCELDSEPAQASLFGRQVEVQFEPTRIADRIDACNVRGPEAIRAFLTRFVPSTRVVGLLLRNSIARIFFESAPGIMETVQLDRVAHLAESGTYDLLIVDMPATGHAWTLLRLPRAMAEVISVGNLSKHFERLADVIADPVRSALMVVSLPEEMPVTESLEFLEQVEHGIETKVAAVILNGVRSFGLRATDLRAAESLPEAGPWRRLRDALSLAWYWQRDDAAGKERLNAEAKVPVVECRWFFRRDNDLHLTEELAASLEQSIRC